MISPITYENLRGASHTNPSTYQEGTTCAFAPPTTIPGYTFAGWDPAGISADVTGNMTIRATWTANTYTLVYHANGGSGTMDATICTYDRDALVGTNCFTWADHIFQGWATNENGAVIHLGNPAAPSLTTPATRPGLTYTLREGTTLKSMSNGATKQGDGQP